MEKEPIFDFPGIISLSLAGCVILKGLISVMLKGLIFVMFLTARKVFWHCGLTWKEDSDLHGYSWPTIKGVTYETLGR